MKKNILIEIKNLILNSFRKPSPLEIAHFGNDKKYNGNCSSLTIARFNLSKKKKK